MALRDQLRALIETVPDDRVEEAISVLRHLEDDEPLSEQELANLESSVEDRKLGRMAPLERYERERGP